MDAEAADDPFSSLVRLIEPTASQGEILENCPFANEFDTFPDPDADGVTSSSQSWASPEQPHPVLVMVTPPESHDGGDSGDQNTTQEEDKYHTPPDHSLSVVSDSDDPKQPPPPPEITVLGGDRNPTKAIEEEEEVEQNLGFRSDQNLKSSDGNITGENPPPQAPPPPTAVCGEGNPKTVLSAVKIEVEGNPEFMESQLGKISNGECCDCVIRDHEVEILEFVSDGKRGLEDEISVHDWKKIRLNEEMVELDSEEYDEKPSFDFDEKKVSANVGSAEKESKECNRIDKSVNLQEKGEDCRGGGGKGEKLRDGAEGVEVSEDETECESGLSGADDASKDSCKFKDGNSGENVKGVDECIGKNIVGRDSCKDGRGGSGIGRGPKTMRGSGEEGDSSNGSDGMMREGEKLGSGGGKAVRKSLLVIDRFKYDGPAGDRRKKGDGLGKKGSLPSVKDGNMGMNGGSDLGEKGSLPSVEDEEKGDGLGKKGSSPSVEDGEKGDGLGKKGSSPSVKDGNMGMNGGSVLGEKGSPPSVEDGEKDDLGKKGSSPSVKDGNMDGGSGSGKKGSSPSVEDGNKRMTFMEMMELLTPVFKERANDGSGDDILETAKSRGMVFPRPRWWTPDMTN